MDNYKALYLKLFNKITDIVEELQHIQREVEEDFISQESASD